MVDTFTPIKIYPLLPTEAVQDMLMRLDYKKINDNYAKRNFSREK